MYDRVELCRQVLREINATGAVSPDDIRWCSTILQRREPKQDGLQQLKPVIEACFEYNRKKRANAFVDAYDDYQAQWHIQAVLTLCKNYFYRQLRVVVACPQRVQHLPDGSQPPNLGGIIAAQTIRAESDQCFGLDHIEARNYFAEKALASNVYSHVFFLDEDTLIPLRAIDYLLSLELEAVGLNYVKKTPILESIATRLEPSNRDVWRNQSVSADDPTNLTPQHVNCLGLGALLVDVETLRKTPKPWFKFTHETNPDGSQGRLMLGEDSHFCRQMLLSGIKTHIIPGMVAIHCDFKTGGYYGPEWLCDPVTRTIRPEHVQHYTHFTVDPKKLYEQYDNSDIFGRGRPKAA